MSFAPFPMSLRQLQYAVAIADTLSFRQAAALCRVSQPSLSAQLAELESCLGVQLFERDRVRVLLTPQGTELIARARVVLRAASDVADLALRSQDPLSGTLRIGVIPTISPYFLPALAAALRTAFPNLSVFWVEEKTEVVVRKLQDGSLDCAVVALPAELADLEHAAVGRDPFVLAAPEGHFLATSGLPCKISQLEGTEVLLLDDGHCFGAQALAFCAQAKAEDLAFRATSLSTLVQMVSGGAGVTLLPRLAVSTELARSTLVVRDFVDPAPYRTIAFAWRNRSPLRDSFTTLAQSAVGVLAGLVERTVCSEPPKRPKRAANDRR